MPQENQNQREYTLKGLKFTFEGDQIRITSDGPVMFKCSLDEWEKIEHNLGLPQVSHSGTNVGGQRT